MTQRRYKQGLERSQGMLLPPSMEEYVTKDNPVRAIDVYVNSLNMEELGFQNTTGGLTPGQPAYPPPILLKLYLYGYLNGVRCSRRLEKQIETYLEEMEKADEEEAKQEGDDKPLEGKLEALKERQQKHSERLSKLLESGEKQISEVDEDARLLYKNGKAVAGYNVQIAVDEKHKLLVVCEVTNEGNDLRQLLPMAREAQQRLETDTMEVVTDGGYFNPLQIKACVDAGITPFIPERDWNTRVRVQGRFTQEDFHFNPELDGYECPAGHILNLRSTYMRSGKRIFRYGSKESNCVQCTHKDKCLPDKTSFRQITRWEHEHVLKVHRERMAQQGSEKSRLRAAIAEHPFGTLKQQFGCTHFLLRGVQKVSVEMDLMMLSITSGES